MARSRFDNLDPEKQEAIFAAAAEEFAERGYEAASLNRIAERSGTSKGSLYYYFENKADLFTTVVERAGARAAGAATAWSWIEDLTAERYWEVLREQSRRAVRELKRNDWYMKIARSFFRLLEEPAAREATTRALEESRRNTKRWLARGQELGVVRMDLPLPMLVELIMGMSEGAKRWMLEHWDEWTDEEAAQVLDAYVDVVRDTLDAAHEGWDR